MVWAMHSHAPTYLVAPGHTPALRARRVRMQPSGVPPADPWMLSGIGALCGGSGRRKRVPVRAHCVGFRLRRSRSKDSNQQGWEACMDDGVSPENRLAMVFDDTREYVDEMAHVRDGQELQLSLATAPVGDKRMKPLAVSDGSV